MTEVQTCKVEHYEVNGQWKGLGSLYPARELSIGAGEQAHSEMIIMQLNI
jgi:hypothetical protein